MFKNPLPPVTGLIHPCSLPLVRFLPGYTTLTIRCTEIGSSNPITHSIFISSSPLGRYPQQRYVAFSAPGSLVSYPSTSNWNFAIVESRSNEKNLANYKVSSNFHSYFKLNSWSRKLQCVAIFSRREFPFKLRWEAEEYTGKTHSFLYN